MPENKTKIVVLSAFYEPFMSGAEQMVKEVLERSDSSYDFTLITSRLDRELLKKEKRENFLIIRVGFGYRFDKFLYPIFCIPQILKIRPRIIHAIMESYAGLALLFIKFFYKKGLRILTLQSGDLDDPKKQRNFFIKLFWKSIHTSPNIVTAISNFLADRAIRLGAKKENVLIIPNGVDFSKIPEGIEQEKNRVICVARLSWEKGIDYLINAWKEVVSEINDARLVLVGDGPKRKEIENLIKDLNLNDSVLLMGNLPHEETLEEISKSEVFVCPSLAEGLGIVFIEAQGCHVSAIGTKVGGIPDVITNNENGVLIEPKNSKQIYEAITKLLKDKNLRDRIVQSADQSVRKYDWSHIVNKIYNLYKDCE